MAAREFIDAARKLRGARWRHRGRKPWAVDCIGLVALAARESGLDTPDEQGYGREPWEDRLRKGLRARLGEPLPKGDARPGDIALVRWTEAEPSHIGIVGDHPDGGLTLIHSTNLAGVIEQSMTAEVLLAVIEVYRPWKDA